MDVKEEDILGQQIHDHWYYVSKGRVMRQVLGHLKSQTVLDVGAGSGVFSRQLLDAGICESAICVDPNYSSEREENYHDKQIRFVKAVGELETNLILMMDVLEHVDDDLGLLNSYVESLAIGGHIFITVPAFQFMWSGHDMFLEHRRRYTIDQIDSLVARAGLTPIFNRYFFASLFPLVAMVRMAKRVLQEQGSLKPESELKLYPSWLNTALIKLHDVERAGLFRFNKAFGLSVCCLCQKRA